MVEDSDSDHDGTIETFNHLGSHPVDAPVADPERSTTAPARASVAVRFARATVLLTVLAVTLLTGWCLWPPAPKSSSAPATEFSAERALVHIDQIAAVPRPTGSPAALAVREILVDELRGLGLDPRIQTRVVSTQVATGRYAAGRVSNVYAHIPGTQPGKAVVLVAHYDSIPSGPGASDNGVNVAAALEVARALRAGPPTERDVDIVFTDGEEQGLLGAQAYVDSGLSGDPSDAVVVNLEARGVSGRAVAFEVVGTGLMDSITAGSPVTTSLASAVYARLPNDTDLSVFTRAGFRGVNLAFFGGSADYHTSHDDVAHVRAATVQDQGAAALATVRRLADETGDPGSSKPTYFWVAGVVLAYPEWLAVPLAVTALVAYAGMLMLGKRRQIRPRRLLRAAVTFPIVPAAAAVTGLVGWWLLTRLRPDFMVTITDVYQPWPYAMAELVMLVVVIVGWLHWCRRRASALEVVAGILGWLTLLALLSAWILPGGAYLFTWPALLGSTAVSIARHSARDWVGILALAVAPLSAIALLGPIALLLVPALGLAASSVSLTASSLVMASVLAPLRLELPWRRFLLGLFALTCVAAFITRIALGTDRYTTHSPRPVSLAYVLQAGGRDATWVSMGGPDQPIVGPLVDGEEMSLNEQVPALGPAVLSTGPAPIATLDPPRVEGLRRSTLDGYRLVKFRLVAPPGADAVELFVDPAGGEVVGGAIDEAQLGGGFSSRSSSWRWSVRYAGPPESGVQVTLRIRGTGPVSVRVVSTTQGLPGGISAPQLPPGLSWVGYPAPSGQTLIVTAAQV